jgi:hypothetical protein
VHVQGLVRDYLLHQKNAERAQEELEKVNVKIGEYDSMVVKAGLMLQQLSDLETGFSRQRKELARGSVHVNMANRRRELQVEQQDELGRLHPGRDT